ncbi:MAG: hypothetical protein ABIQ01_01640 [Pseudolysinimonas sp.]
MDVFIHWAAFAGAWLLVGGPLFQAAVELSEEEFDNSQFDEIATRVEAPPHISGWWWLLPPVAYYRSRKRSNAHRRAMMKELHPDQRQQMVGLMNKATGWFTVAGGAFLIALKETWELTELYELPVAVYWVAVVVLLVAAISNTAVRMSRADAIVHVDDPNYEATKRAGRARATAQRRKRQGNPARPQRTQKPSPADDA